MATDWQVTTEQTPFTDEDHAILLKASGKKANETVLKGIYTLFQGQDQCYFFKIFLHNK